MKEHEKILFALCYNLCSFSDYYGFTCRLSPRQVINALNDTIPHKRCWYYLKKWEAAGFYSSGVSFDLGWLDRDEIPEKYIKIIMED